jgi:hypothetical protein
LLEHQYEPKHRHQPMEGGDWWQGWVWWTRLQGSKKVHLGIGLRRVKERGHHRHKDVVGLQGTEVQLVFGLHWEDIVQQQASEPLFMI